MTTWILMLAAVALAVLGFRQVGGWGKHGLGLSVLGILVVVSGFFVWREWSLESRLTEAVQELVSDPEVEVNCQGFFREFRLDNNLGEVGVDQEGNLSTRAELRGSVCSQLRSWIGSDKSNPTRDQVIAVHVLAHEAVHATGVRDEGRTECLAMQSDEELALLLGASPVQAVALADQYWTEVYPRMPGPYRPIECREDADLDESPGDGLWPGNRAATAGAATPEGR